MHSIEQNIRSWHEEGIGLSSQHKRNEARMVELLSKLYESKGYLLYQSESLRNYALYVWELPENAAKDMVTVAIKASEVPQILEALSAGHGTVSKIRKVCSVITSENAAEWLDLVKECSSRIVERAVAMNRTGEELPQAQLRYNSSGRLDLINGISEKLLEKLEYIQDLLSQETKRPASLEDALDEMANLYLEKKDPVRKAERAQKRKSAGRQKVVTGRSHSKSPQRKKLSAETKHALNLRDGRQCTEMGP
ncbi:MAG: hypothetical protein AB7O96_04565, partial [Pseudobdellovibrionaceae bacterium]